MTFDIIGWGALNIDRLCHVDEFADKDGETYVNYETKTCGGSAANTIIGISRLGLSTGYIGKVGDDSNGEMMRKHLRDNKVGTKLIIKGHGSTGEVTGFINRDGDRKLYVTPNVNDTISKNEIDMEPVRSAKILHLTSFAGLNSEESIKSQLEVIKQVPGEVRVSFDPGMLYIQRGWDFISQFLEYTDILLINRKELMLLTRKNTLGEAVDFIYPHVEILVVKNSTKGSYIKCSDGEYKINVFNVDTKDTTGAGDAYNAGFLYGLLSKHSIYDSGIIASYIAARSTTKTGATEALPYIDDMDLDEIIKNY